MSTWHIHNAGIQGNTGFYQATIADSSNTEIITYRESVLGQTYPQLEQRAKLIASAPDLVTAVRLALQRADSELRMMSLNAHGTVEHQSLSTFANKCAEALSACGESFSRYDGKS